MASEDSVDNILQRSLSLLAIVIHRIGKPYDPDQTLLGAMHPLFEELQRLLEAQDVRSSRGIDHESIEERDHLFRNRAPRRDGEHQHVRVALFREDAARSEVFLDELEEGSPIPMSVHEKFGIDEEPVLGGRVFLDGDTHAALSFNHTRDKPRLSFLG